MLEVYFLRILAGLIAGILTALCIIVWNRQCEEWNELDEVQEELEMAQDRIAIETQIKREASARLHEMRRKADADRFDRMMEVGNEH